MEEGRTNRHDTGIRRPHRFARNVEYKLPPADSDLLSLSLQSAREENENLRIINNGESQKVIAHVKCLAHALKIENFYIR